MSGIGLGVGGSAGLLVEPVHHGAVVKGLEIIDVVLKDLFEKSVAQTDARQRREEFVLHLQLVVVVVKLSVLCHEDSPPLCCDTYIIYPNRAVCKSDLREMGAANTVGNSGLISLKPLYS